MNNPSARRCRAWTSLLAALLLAGSAAAAKGAGDAAGKVSFSKDIRPILKASCMKCHGFNKKHKKGAAELRLDDEKLAMKGGRSGKAIIPGDAKDSLLFKLLHGPVPRPDKTESDKDIPPMPKAPRGKKWKPLPQDKIDLIGRWIDQGALWNN